MHTTPRSGGRRRRKSSLLDTQNEIVRRVSKIDLSRTESEMRGNSCLTRMSWYQDALQQQGVSEADLQALLAAENEEEKELPREKQVAEQHRIMAINKARKMLEESLGHPFETPEQLDFMGDFDPMQQRPKYSPQLILPELPSPATDDGLLERQTCLIPPSVPIDISLGERKNPVCIDPTEEPDLQIGEIAPEGSKPTRGTIVVQCTACPLLLRVSIQAALVRCPQCQELTPASDVLPSFMEWNNSS